MNEEQCYQCTNWEYNDRIEKKYGEGTGLCTEDRQPKGCNKSACLLFNQNKNIKIS